MFVKSENEEIFLFLAEKYCFSIKQTIYKLQLTSNTVSTSFNLSSKVYGLGSFYEKQISFKELIFFFMAAVNKRNKNKEAVERL